VLIERIDDPDHPRLADYRNLKDAELRRRHGLFIAESREVVRRLLALGRFRVRSVLLTAPALDSLHDSLEAAGSDIVILLARHETVRTVAGFDFHRGCVAIGERGPEPALGELLGPPGARRLIVLDDVTNPDNVGGIFRNAVAFGVHGVLLSPGCADPLYRKTIRVSIGGSLSVPFRRLADWPASLTRLRESGYTMVALAPRADAIDIAEFGTTRPTPERLAILLGAEGRGLSASAVNAAHLEVKIEMAPGADSLNVATACGIALHRLAAQRDDGSWNA
jgi:tRNA G18 (ribose-2'-O)-methylase SpoU